MNDRIRYVTITTVFFSKVEVLQNCSQRFSNDLLCHLSSKQTPTDTFTMDEAFVHPLKVIYKYDNTRLEEIELPEILNLDSILTRI